jgi:hypothetical protein
MEDASPEQVNDASRSWRRAILALGAAKAGVDDDARSVRR